PIKIYYYVVLAPVFFFYSIFSELFLNGRSVGKLALGIRVVKLNGKQATLSDFIIRWMFRLVDIYMSFGTLATILISSTDKSQRIGDIIANTVLINVRPSRSQRLKDLLSIQSLDTYQPQYPDVKYLNEEDMLLVKSVLERKRKYGNEAHLLAEEELVKHLMGILKLNKLNTDNSVFLKTLLKDYIVLTR
ncbi:MAG: RDD family protein, partial [Bacteroidia bacterium]